MKIFFKNLLTILVMIIKVALIVLVFLSSYSFLNRIFYNKDIYDGRSFHSLPENSMDVIVLGSSHAQYSFIPHFFYEQTGLYSYVQATSCQPIEVSYQMLKESLKTQQPKAVILEVYTALPLRIVCEADSSYVIAEYQMTGEEKINTIKYLPEEKAKEYYNDFTNYHNNWRYIENIDDLKPKEENYGISSVDETFGYIYQEAPEYYPENWWPASVYDDSVNMDVELDDLDVESLNNIKKLCDDNDIELILYKTPIDSIDIENQSYLHKIWEWAKENDVSYIDFIAKGRDIEFYMWIHSDSFHAYINGAGMITTYLADLINEKNIEFNHVENQEITDLLINAGQNYTAEYIKSEYDPLKYLKVLKNSHGYVFLRYNISNYRMERDLYNLLLDLGIDNDFDERYPFFAIIKDGEIIKCDTEELNYSLDGHEIKIDSEKVMIDDETYAYDGSALSFVYTDYNFNNRVNKSIEYRGWTWDFGVPSYIR